MPRLHPPCLVLLVALPALAPAADPLAESVREAVAARKLRDSELKGAPAARAPYRDLAADGALLVGLEVGLGGPPGAEHVVAVRPVYRAGDRTRTGSPAGHFLADEVTRTVRLSAREGYAVAGLFVSADGRVDGLAVRFARIDRAGLDPADAYESPWVGCRQGPREPIDGHGQPAAGLFGRVHGDAVVAVGLTFADLPRPVASATPSPARSPVVQAEPRPVEPAAEESGTWPWAAIAVVALALPAGLAGAAFLRRKPGGVQQLPPVPRVRMSSPAAVMPEGPPSIPGYVLAGPLAPTTPAPPAADPAARPQTELAWR